MRTDVTAAARRWADLRGTARQNRWGEALVSAYEQGRQAWPALELPVDDFVAHVARVFPADGTLPDLESAAGDGLYLCAACARGDARAQAVFEAVFLRPLHRVVGKVGATGDAAGDVLQQIRAQFFAPKPGQPSAFLSYSGRGALAVWLKVLAVRAAQKQRRGAAKNAEVPDEGLGALPGTDADPELRFLKLQHRKYFKAVFAEVLEALEARERSVLRMSLVEGLSIDDIGRVYDVHRATAARWLAAARERLVQRTRQGLAERLKVSEAELDEVMGAVQSQLSISLGAGLASKGPSRR